MLKKILIANVAMVAVNVAFSQDFRKVNWEQIDFEVNNPASKFYYPALFARFEQADTTLNMDEYFYIYYGYSTQQNYKPLLETQFRDQLKEVFAKKNTVVDFNKIISLTKEILSTEPFNLRDINALAFALNLSDRKEEAAKEIRKLDMLVKTIQSTGNGLSQSTAWYVIYTENCEDLLAFLGFNTTRKMIVSTEVLFVQVSNMPDNQKKYKGYYFNYAEIYKRRPDYLDGIDKPKRKMEFNPKYNPKSDLNVLKKTN